jgi:hypothetical protein
MGEFEDALVGTNKVVNARFTLQDSATGQASNYQLTNPVEVLRASILPLALVAPAVSQSQTGNGLISGTRVKFAGGSGSGAATGVSDGVISTELVDQCSVLNPEKCECEATKIQGVELCSEPRKLVTLKD